jgi:hypothetical protein
MLLIIVLVNSRLLTIKFRRKILYSDFQLCVEFKVHTYISHTCVQNYIWEK